MVNEDANPEGVAADLPVIEYASPSAKPRRTLAYWIALGVLVLSLVVYGVACIPSYSRSWWPPIDRLREAPPWLWIFAIPIFTLLMQRGRACIVPLLVYALLTSVIDAWTFPFDNMNPHPRFDAGLWFANQIFTTPLHLVLAAVIGLLSRLAYRLAGILPLATIPQSRSYRWSRAALVVIFSIGAAVFPFAYRDITVARDMADGARMADADWASHQACVISDDTAVFQPVGDRLVTSYFDTDSGLPLRQSWRGRWEAGYNAEIRRLLKDRGVPSWSLKNRFPSNADLISILTATDMKLITSYPFNLSHNIVLFRGGGVTPWGNNTIYSNSKYLDIESRNQDRLPMGNLGEEKDPAYVGQLSRYPGVYFVRCGGSIVACTADGWILEVVTN